MSRGRSERKPDVRQNQMQSYAMKDPFQDMHQVMKNFGRGFGFSSFENDDFFGRDLMMPMKDPFQNMMSFNNAHKNIHKNGKEGSYVCQTFVSSSTMGADGKMNKQSYFQNSAGQNSKGQTISQTQQAYKNSDGVNRIAEERMLNDKGRKIVKDRRGNNIEETNHYYNIDDQEANQFDNDWRNANQNMKFLQNHQRFIQQGPGQAARMIRNQPIREERERFREIKPETNYNQKIQSRPYQPELMQNGSRFETQSKASSKPSSYGGSNGSRKY